MYMVHICIRAVGQGALPLTAEAFGVSVYLPAFPQGASLTITEEGGVFVSAAEACGAATASAEYAEEVDEAAPSGEAGLFEKLSALRKKISSEAGVPPYVVFQDGTLSEMCRLLPADLNALKCIRGVGAAKLEKYGEAFTAAIRAHTGAA
jgi:superfamily II DNA helicase RecQ